MRLLLEADADTYHMFEPGERPIELAEDARKTVLEAAICRNESELALELASRGLLVRDYETLRLILREEIEAYRMRRGLGIPVLINENIPVLHQACEQKRDERLAELDQILDALLPRVLGRLIISFSGPKRAS